MNTATIQLSGALHMEFSLFSTNKVVSKGVQRVHFIKETGEGVNKRRRKPQFGVLHKAKDFILDVDLDPIFCFAPLRARFGYTHIEVCL